MEKGKWIYLIDVGLLLSFLGVTVTGLIKFRSLHYLLGMDINYDALPTVLLRTIHDWSGFAMAVLVLMHLILHWGWIVETTKSYFKPAPSVPIKNSKIPKKSGK